MRERRDLCPVLLKYGVAVAVSLGGILYTILRNKPSKRTPLLPPSTVGDPTDEDCSSRATPRSILDQPSPATPPSRLERPLQLQTTPPAGASGSMASEKHAGLSGGFTDIYGPSSSCRFEGKDDELNEVAALRECICVERDEHDQEVRRLKDIVKTLKERERTLEIQLLEYYGLKEQETAVMELQNRIKINNMEAKLFNLKIESLKADKRRLEGQVSDYAKIVSELEAARVKIKQLKKKLRHEAEHSKEQIRGLHEKVMKLHDQEKKALETLHYQEKRVLEAESDVHNKLQKIEDLEMEAEELRNSNNSLRMENSELSQRLEYVQIIATSVVDDEDTEALRAEAERLQKQNEDMAKEIEQLQADRCTDAEELVYLRWVNACLRYELRNYQPDPCKTIARDLSNTLSPNSEEKAKQLILEYARKEGSGEPYWPSPQASYFTDSGEPDDTSVDHSLSTITLKAHTSGKRKVFSKLMRLIRGKGHSHDRVPSGEYNARKYLPPAGVSPASNSVFSVVDAGPDGFNSRSRTSSEGSSSRHSSHGLKHCSYQEGITKSPQEHLHKCELVKYAEVLKEARSLPSSRRRSASFSSVA